MSRLPNRQGWGNPAPPPGADTDLYPIGERPDPARPVIRVDAATWRTRGLWKWSEWPPDFEVGVEMDGRASPDEGIYRLTFPGKKYMEQREYDHRQLKRARSVANALHTRMRRNGLTFPSLETIAVESSFKADNIPGLLRILNELGYLHIHHGGGRQANRYWATLPEPIAKARDSR